MNTSFKLFLAPALVNVILLGLAIVSFSIDTQSKTGCILSLVTYVWFYITVAVDAAVIMSWVFGWEWWNLQS
ncbi:hypothetical protein BU23DRAFT_562251 [Bimuria novae-zelandiae CBS 107.79]|uniref:Uncharacterized protein n=1 Tax=Bimuria novae-zelandiae CBS 107.79 TaxID=1447943 RepID=A0A6A5UH18_9PLEO|nr:hypothetical protein BU23DRAFT_562251 [Bimuria novae-zelandiae CBS 107.79]